MTPTHAKTNEATTPSTQKKTRPNIFDALSYFIIMIFWHVQWYGTIFNRMSMGILLSISCWVIGGYRFIYVQYVLDVGSQLICMLWPWSEALMREHSVRVGIFGEEGKNRLHWLWLVWNGIWGGMLTVEVRFHESKWEDEVVIGTRTSKTKGANKSVLTLFQRDMLVAHQDMGCHLFS